MVLIGDDNGWSKIDVLFDTSFDLYSELIVNEISGI